jgi:hypothetical protein
MEENQKICLSGFDLVLLSVDRAGQNDQEAKVELHSSDACVESILLWEVILVRFGRNDEGLKVIRTVAPVWAELYTSDGFMACC